MHQLDLPSKRLDDLRGCPTAGSPGEVRARAGECTPHHRRELVAHLAVGYPHTEVSCSPGAGAARAVASPPYRGGDYGERTWPMATGETPGERVEFYKPLGDARSAQRTGIGFALPVLRLDEPLHCFVAGRVAARGRRRCRSGSPPRRRPLTTRAASRRHRARRRGT